MATPYSIFNKSTGEIVRSGTCPGSGFKLQKYDPETEMIVAEVSNNLEHVFKIKDGKATRKDRTKGEIAAIKAKRDKDIKPVKPGKQFARITNDQLQYIMDEINQLKEKLNVTT